MALIEEVQHPLLEQHGIRMDVLRDDQLHPEISGNKWRKLIPNFEKAAAVEAKTVITFGGAYSNHIAATASAGKEFSIKTIGLIRGENSGKNPTLERAIEQGMELKFYSRKEYRELAAQCFLDGGGLDSEGNFWIPEGGANQIAMNSCAEITRDRKEYDFFAVAAGTGTTAGGMAMGALQTQKVLAFPAIKIGAVNELAHSFPSDKIEWYTKYHFGGYAKVSQELIEFVLDFWQSTGIPLDLVYTGKMMFGLLDRVAGGLLPVGSRVLAIHSGGLQGNRGMVARGMVKDLPAGLLGDF